jgi:proline iminopeptidase
MLFPDAWARFLAPIPAEERHDLMSAYHRRLTDPDRRVQARSAAAWSQWEGDTLSLRGPQARPAKFSEADFAIAFARIECHYFVNRGFFETDGWLLDNIDAIRGIPAWKLKQAWPEAHFDVIWDAGHASTEPGIIDALVRATDQALA